MTGVLAGNPVDFARYAAMGAKYLPMTLTSMIAGAMREAVALRKGARAAPPRSG